MPTDCLLKIKNSYMMTNLVNCDLKLASVKTVVLRKVIWPPKRGSKADYSSVSLLSEQIFIL